MREGIAVAEAPQLRTLDEWMVELADLLAPGRLLLGPAIERALWESVIREAGGPDIVRTLDLRALAAQAAQAFERLCAWGEPDWDREVLSRDAAEFRVWLVHFRRRLLVSRWVVAAELPVRFADAVESGALDGVRPASIAFVGFERLEPVVERICTVLRNAGSDVQQVEPASASCVTPLVRSAKTRNDELRLAAREIHARLLVDPRLRIGVLTPDVGEVRSLLVRVFEEELEAADLLDPDAVRARCFEVSAAPRMTDYPLISHAFDLLSLHADSVSFEQASRVLLAPYPRLTGEEDNGAAVEDEREFEGRALAEAKLRSRNVARLPLASHSSSHGLAAVARESGAGRFAQRLENLAALLSKDPALDAPGRWRVNFIHRLDAMKWPGTVASEVEGILFRRWRDALADLAAVEVLFPSMSAADALAHLRSICTATTVQASSEGPPVQVMGLLDAAGLEFDVIYAIGMTSTAFPSAARPNPLLPVVWQRLARHPRAGAEGEREFAEKVWRRVCASAPEVIASYAVCDQSGEEKSASALLLTGNDAHLLEKTAPAAAAAWWAPPDADTEYRQPRSIATAPAVLVRRGTATLISNQAACPFRAFATHRLGADKLSRIELQPSASLRGNLVHAALEEVYRQVRDRQGLARLSANNLQALVERACDVALAEKGGDLDLGIRGFARNWLLELVRNWLLFEGQERQDEWAIHEIEKPREARLPHGDAQGIEFHVRLDRIDRLADGGLLLIDFKTSAVEKSAARWAGERPEEPQLPLYATLLARDGNNRIDGLAFANLAARDACSLVGLASTQLGGRLGPAKVRKSAGGAAPAFCGDFAADLAAMQNAIDALARDYLRGDVRVAPKKPEVCKNCGMESLCRVFEGDVDEAEIEAEEETQEP